MNDVKEQWGAAPGLHISAGAVDEFVRVCVKNSEYDLVSGGHGKSYIDVDEIFGPNDGDSELLSELLTATAESIRHLVETEGYNMLGFIDGRRGPAGAISLRTLLGREVGMESIILRPYKRLLSQAIKPFRVRPESRVLLITDVTTTGRNVVDAARLLWQAGARGCGALTIANRQEGAEESLATMDIPLHHILAPLATDAA
jgi:hypothetical protein